MLDGVSHKYLRKNPDEGLQLFFLANDGSSLTKAILHPEDMCKQESSRARHNRSLSREEKKLKKNGQLMFNI